MHHIGVELLGLLTKLGYQNSLQMAIEIPVVPLKFDIFINAIVTLKFVMFMNAVVTLDFDIFISTCLFKTCMKVREQESVPSFCDTFDIVNYCSHCDT